MTRYVECGVAEKFLRDIADRKMFTTGIEYANGIVYAACHIGDVPEAKVREVSEGHWINVRWGKGIAHGQCSRCRVSGALRIKANRFGALAIDMPICPACGAEMGEGEV